MSKKKFIPKISVVIPTIGEPILKNTVDSLLNSTLKPSEVIIVIPNKFLHRINLKKNKVIKIINSSIEGQVQQRIEGFKIAKGDFVLQLDADIVIDKNCLSQLCTTLCKLKTPSVVMPTYNQNIIKKNISQFFIKDFLSKFIYMGVSSIKNQGIKFTWDVWYKSFEWPEKLSEMNYVNGACLLHKRSNLIIDDYYPYDGKAYGEDLLHSFMLTKNGVKLFCEPLALAINNDGHYEFNTLTELKKFIYRTFLYKKFLTQESGGSMFRFYLWFSLYSMNQIYIFFKKA
jgi:glycosyltransferase involved in cell wall biosynthesis